MALIFLIVINSLMR